MVARKDSSFRWKMIGNGSPFHAYQAEMQMLGHILDLVRGFERWFDQRFGWFFTNGMKHGPRVEPLTQTEEMAVADGVPPQPTA